MEIFSLFLFATVIATSHATGIPHQIHLLRPHFGAAGHHIPGLSCLSWRLAVETDNIRDWDLVPESCESYVGHYMLGHQYRKDCSAAAAAAAEYVMSLKLAGDGKDIWIFDIDETALSNLPYFARPENAFGAKSEEGTTAVMYKSSKRKELDEEGYRILGNMGDQWSDLFGTHVGNRTFKVPNPMYYAS